MKLVSASWSISELFNVIVRLAAIVPPPLKIPPADILTDVWSICSFATKFVVASWSICEEPLTPPTAETTSDGVIVTVTSPELPPPLKPVPKTFTAVISPVSDSSAVILDDSDADNSVNEPVIRFPAVVPKVEFQTPFVNVIFNPLIVEPSIACLWLPIANSLTFPWNPVVLTGAVSASYACKDGAASEP